jgi:uncharacterized protein DUF4214/Kelch motif protein/HYDIN/CFA65/VesB family protein
MGHQRDRAAPWIVAVLVMWLLAVVEPAEGAGPFGDWVTTGRPTGNLGDVLLVELPDAPPLLFGFPAGEVRQYRPETGEWTRNGSLQAPAEGGSATATLLSSGVVLVAGGSRAELYDPTTGTSTITGSMRFGRSAHQATLLDSGHVLVSGGLDANTELVGPTEIYDPAAGTWTVVGALNEPRRGHAAVRLANGKVLVAGGFAERLLASAEVYDPATGVWTLAAPMDRWRETAAGVPLVDGRVLVVGRSLLGVDSQMYDPATETWTSSVAASSTTFAGGLVLLRNGTPLLVLGACIPKAFCVLREGAVFDLQTGSWNPTNPGPLQFFGLLRLGALLPDGRALFANGAPPGAVLFRPDNTTPRLVVSPLSISFGRIDRGAAVDQSVRLENTGDATLTGTVTAAAPFSVVSGSPFTLAPGQSAMVDVRFAPSGFGDFTGVVQLASNGGWQAVSVNGASPAQARLSGRVVDASGVGVEAISVHLGGPETGDTVTDGAGNYQFLVRLSGGYTVTPTSPGLTFTPGLRNVVVGTQDVSAVDFTTPSPNAAAAFVARLYQEVLGRSPDAAGLTGWAGFLHQQCDASRLRAVANSFFDSPEFRNRQLTLTGLVSALYRALLARDPDAAELVGWVDVFRQDRLTPATAFIESDEFRNLLPDRTDRLAVNAVTEQLYRAFTGRVPAPSELEGRIDYIVATGDVEGVAVGFMTSAEFERVALTFRETVSTLYIGILRRGPDPAGLEHWTDILQSSLLSIVNDGFLSSAEFRALVPNLCGT